jgi:transcriptional regulator with XRE-family HTH domain
LGSFGQSVRRQRKLLRLTQEKFADKARISRRHLQLIEADKVSPTIQMARLIKETCHCSWQDLLD